MKEKIKTIYLILGVILLIIVGLAVIIWISKQVNWEFFTFDKEKCIANYLIEKEKYFGIENLSDEKLKEIAQIWNLNLNNLMELRENEKQKAEKRRKEYEEEYKEYRKCQELQLSDIREKGFVGRGCVAPLQGLFPSRVLESLLEEQIQDEKYPKLPKSIINELTSEGICPHPSFLK